MMQLNNLNYQEGTVEQVDEDGTVLLRMEDGSVRSVRPNDPTCLVMKIAEEE